MYMRSFDEAKCRICKRIFCCGNCRQKHQFEAHAIAVTQPLDQHNQVNGADHEMSNKATTETETIYVFCPICEQKPLTLRKEMYTELLAHIESVHLPLRCRKCQRNYLKIEDLREFSKCLDGLNCSSASSVQNQTCDTDASKVTVKKAAVAANTISTQTSPSIAKDINESDNQQYQPPNQSNLTPISLFNLRWKAKSRLTQEEFNSDSVSSIRNLSSDSVNLSEQQRRSIGLVPALPEKGKVIRSTSTPLPLGTMLAKPKDTLTFNASSLGGAHMSSIYHSGYVLDEQNVAPTSAPLDSNQPHQPPPPPPQRAWKVGGRGKISAVTPLRQVMSKSIQKAFVEHGILAGTQGAQRRMRLDMSENSSSEAGFALDLRMSPVVRRSQSVEENLERNQATRSLRPPEPYQIMLSAQKLTTESIIITRTRHSGNSSSFASTASASTTSTVYNSCESLEIITSSTAQLSANVTVPPITPIARIPGAIINKKLIKFETPQKKQETPTSRKSESISDDTDIFYTPASEQVAGGGNEQRRQQILPRQLSDEFSRQQLLQLARPQGPRARPPLRACQTQNAFSSVQDLISDDEDVAFLPNSASTHNDKKCIATAAADGQSEPGRLWSLVSSVMRLPLALRTDRSSATVKSGRSSSIDKENTASNSTNSTGSLIRRCASIAGSLVRTIKSHDDAELQSLKRKRTQTLDNQYYSHMSPSSSSKRVRIQARKPVDRMRRELS